ncbi:MAG: o-succinylbenzoate--CoA ligase [Anaerolineae bacterium]|nr:o-succinylbenzoate--CoA ligase [Anaerolineae bacterium]
MLPNWLRQRTYLTPDRLALISSTSTLTFRELEAQALRRARQLAQSGVRAGDKVALLLHNRSEYVILMHAINMIGAVVVPLNTRLTPAEIAWQIGNSGAKLMICDEETADTAAVAAQERAGAEIAFSEDEAAEDQTPILDFYDLNAPHSIIYTSGTTGKPKGAILTFGNFWWSSIGSALNLGHQLDDRWLAVLPLFHVGGMSILIKSVIYGIPTVLHNEFDAAAVNRSVDEDGVTIISAVSVMLSRMLEQRGDKPYPPSLRCVLLGGGPAPRPLLEECARRNIPVVQTYGLTEAASQVATLPPEDALRKLGSAGKPLLPTELRIVANGQTLPRGDVGEISVRGASISPGYLKSADNSEREMRDAQGWLLTGDIGYLDDEGYLYVLDRRDDLIISGGENVYPAEVEAALLAYPEVSEAGVVGIADATWGQVPVAAVKPRNGEINVDDLREFLNGRLAQYKVPKEIRVMSELPRNAAGKLVRRRLQESWVVAQRESATETSDAPSVVDEAK